MTLFDLDRGPYLRDLRARIERGTSSVRIPRPDLNLPGPRKLVTPMGFGLVVGSPDLLDPGIWLLARWNPVMRARR